MKKLQCLMLAVILVLLVGCQSSNVVEVQSNYDDNGNFVIETNGRKTTMLDELPADVVYNDKQITLELVEFYETSVDYSHMLLAVVMLDVSELDDGQLHWLRESDLEVNAYITHEANGYDFNRMIKLGSLLVTDAHKICFTYISPLGENRYSFDGGEVSVSVSIAQEETYEFTNDEGKVSTLHKHEAAQYSTTIEGELQSPEAVGEPLYGYIVKWLSEWGS